MDLLSRTNSFMHACSLLSLTTTVPHGLEESVRLMRWQPNVSYGFMELAFCVYKKSGKHVEDDDDDGNPGHIFYALVSQKT